MGDSGGSPDSEGRQGPVRHFCGISALFPTWALLASLACVHTKLPSTASQVVDPPAPTVDPDLFGCQDEVAGDEYVSGWPPMQRLTAVGALASYGLFHLIGGLLDTFGVR